MKIFLLVFFKHRIHGLLAPVSLNTDPFLCSFRERKPLYSDIEVNNSLIDLPLPYLSLSMICTDIFRAEPLVTDIVSINLQSIT